MNESSNANDQGPAREHPREPASVEGAGVEPEISGQDYVFAEPQLGTAEISEDVAESADLEAAEAEAAQVAHEAQLAAKSVSSPSTAGAGAKANADAEVDWDSEATVMRTDFTKEPVATNDWPTRGADTAAGSGVESGSGVVASKAAEGAEGSEAADAKDATVAPDAADAAATEAVAPAATSGGATAAGLVQPEADDAAAAGSAPAPQAPARPTTPPAGEPHTPATSDPAGEAVPASEADTAVIPDAPEVAADATTAAHGTPPPPAAAPQGAQGTTDGHGWRRPETPWQQSQTPWQPKAGGWQSPAQMERGREDAAALAAANGPLVPPAGQQAATPPPSSAAPFGNAPAAHIPNVPGVPPVPGYPGGPQAPQGNGGPQGAYPQGPQGPGYPGGPQGPGYPPGPGQPQGPQGPGGAGTPGSGRKKLFIILGVAVLGLGLIGLFIWMLVNFILGNLAENTTAPEPLNTQSQSGSSTEEAGTGSNATAGPGDKVILPDLSPLKWLEEDCLANFEDASSPADVVLCSGPHNAQLVGTYYYGEEDGFPGVEALKAKATEVCDGVELTSAATSMASLKQTTAYPSESTWTESDDRRVDCIVHDTRDGNQLKESFIK